MSITDLISGSPDGPHRQTWGLHAVALTIGTQAAYHQHYTAAALCVCASALVTAIHAIGHVIRRGLGNRVSPGPFAK